MRFMHRLVRDGFVGPPWHFRAQRFQDWGRRYLGWRQCAADAGTGEIGDMLSHRLDYAHLLVGPIARVMASTRRLLDTRQDAAGVEHPSDLEDWVACIAEFHAGTTGAFESTKVATGYGEGGRSRDRVELNGPDGSLIYELQRPQVLLGARRGNTVAEMPVPADLLTYTGAPLPPGVDPQQAFRWDQNAEFITAIQEGRPAVPSFHDGARVQAVVEAIVTSAAERRSVEVASA
jgi:predicted dehydrogenase